MYRLNFIFLLILFIIYTYSLLPTYSQDNSALKASVPDYYPSLSVLTTHEKLGQDYRIIINNRHSPVTIVAIHGGYIEPGTSAIASAICGHDYNLYIFEGLRNNNRKLHVTATHFRDDDLLKMLKASQLAVSIHSYGTEASQEIWLGGLNLSLKDNLAKYLTASGFKVNLNSPRYRGTSSKNVVNLTPNFGCQIELPQDLINSMFLGRNEFKLKGFLLTNKVFRKFVKAVRQGIREELK